MAITTNNSISVKAWLSRFIIFSLQGKERSRGVRGSGQNIRREPEAMRGNSESGGVANQTHEGFDRAVRDIMDELAHAG
jgi:hypothetical protein